VTIVQAYESILTPADPPLRDRSEEAAGRAIACAQAIIGSFEGESFGWHRRAKRERLLDDQLTILRHFARQDAVPGESIGQGGEHDVWHTENGSHVSKFTINGQFGYVVDQQNDNRSNKLHLRPALASEYLLRLGTQNAVFGDAITLQGVRTAHIPSIVTAQPYADQGRPSQTEIDIFLRQAGFIRLPDEMLMSQYATKPFWWRPSDSVIVGDCNPENYSRLEDCIIVPIDCIAHPFPRNLIESTGWKNGVNLDRLISANESWQDADDDSLGQSAVD